MHENYDREEEITGSSDRGFGIVFTVFFLVLAALKAYVGAYEWAVGWLIAAAIMLILALFASSWLAPFNKLWMKFGLLLHKIVNPIIMGAMFFVVLAPVGLTMRLFGWDALSRRLKPDADTYWVEREDPGPAPDTMKNQF